MEDYLSLWPTAVVKPPVQAPAEPSNKETPPPEAGDQQEAREEAQTPSLLEDAQLPATPPTKPPDNRAATVTPELLLEELQQPHGEDVHRREQDEAQGQPHTPQDEDRAAQAEGSHASVASCTTLRLKLEEVQLPQADDEVNPQQGEDPCKAADSGERLKQATEPNLRQMLDDALSAAESWKVRHEQLEQAHRKLQRQYAEALSMAAGLEAARLEDVDGRQEALSSAEAWKVRYEECAQELKQVRGEAGVPFGGQHGQQHHDCADLDGDPSPPEGDKELLGAWQDAKAANERLLLEASRAGNLTLVKQALADPAANRSYNIRAYDMRTPLHFAVERNDLELAKLLLRRQRIKVNAVAKDGTTPLYRACENRLTELVKLLLSHGADPNIAAPGKQGERPLHVSSSRGDLAAVQALLEKGPNQVAVQMELRNDGGETALHVACSNGHEAVAEILLQKGADLEARDGSKKAATPLHRACMNGHLKTVELLVARNADTQAKTEAFMQHNRRTALEVAERHKQSHIVDYLQRRGTRS